jgi:hypothetical protein
MLYFPRPLIREDPIFTKGTHLYSVQFNNLLYRIWMSMNEL